MHLSEPRVPPISAEEMDALDAEIGRRRKPGQPSLNITRTIAQHPALVKARAPLQKHMLRDSTLPPRERELVILRTGWAWQSEYEFGQHTRMSKEAGVTDADVRRVTEGPDAEGWTPFEATLLRATDELCSDAFISDATWTNLSEHYTTQQLLDLVFLIGQYTTVSMALRTLGVQLEEGTSGFPQSN